MSKPGHTNNYYEVISFNCDYYSQEVLLQMQGTKVSSNGNH